MQTKDILVPLDVPKKAKAAYIRNYFEFTQGSGNLFIFAGDQKMEHLNKDFVGAGIHEDDGDPEHLFRIADEGFVGAFATQLGLIARYGGDYRSVRYLVKLNSKTDIVGPEQADPVSYELATVSDIIQFQRETKLKIYGVGYTIYLGSEHEAEMFQRAAQIIREAHQNGLVVVLWAYPRGKAIVNKRDSDLIAGAAGVAACLGADFVKVDYPEAKNNSAAEALKIAVRAAGKTKVVCAGGASQNPQEFLHQVFEQMEAGAAGAAVGRNIHQKSLPEAVKLCHALRALIIDRRSFEEAQKLLA